MDRFDLAVVASGPCSAALASRLAQIDPGLLHRALFIENATHPRPEVCGGAVTVPGKQEALEGVVLRGGRRR